MGNLKTVLFHQKLRQKRRKEGREEERKKIPGVIVCVGEVRMWVSYYTAILLPQHLGS